MPAGRTVHGQVSNIDFAPTLVDVARAQAGRTMDGVSLHAHGRATRGSRPNTAVEIEAPAPLFEGNVPINAWDRPYKGVRTDRYTYVVYKETGEQELYDRRTDPAELRNVAADPAYAQIKARLAARAGQARPLPRALVRRGAVSPTGRRPAGSTARCGRRSRS